MLAYIAGESNGTVTFEIVTLRSAYTVIFAGIVCDTNVLDYITTWTSVSWSANERFLDGVL